MDLPCVVFVSVQHSEFRGPLAEIDGPRPNRGSFLESFAAPSRFLRNRGRTAVAFWISCSFRGLHAVHEEPREHRADREMRHAWLSLRGFPRGPSLAARGPRRHGSGLVWAVLWFACLVLLVLLHCSLVSVVLRARVHVRKKYITGMVYTVFPGWSMTLVYAIIA